MKARLKEDPKEWRKVTLLTALGVCVLSSLLRWRHALTARSWEVVLGAMLLTALCAGLRPKWFRGFYRVSTQVGFVLSQAIARVLLAVLFLALITPLALLRRGFGKDPLRLKRATGAKSYWSAAKQCGPLDRQF